MSDSDSEMDGPGLLLSSGDEMSDEELLEQDLLQRRDRVLRQKQKQLEDQERQRKQKRGIGGNGLSDPDVVLSRGRASVAELMRDPELARLERLTGAGQMSFLSKNPFVRKDGLVRLSRTTAGLWNAKRDTQPQPPRKKQAFSGSADEQHAFSVLDDSSDDESDEDLFEEEEDEDEEQDHEDQESLDQDEHPPADSKLESRLRRRQAAPVLALTSEAVGDLDHRVAGLNNTALNVQLPELAKTRAVLRKKAAEEKPNAGKGWFDLPATPLTRDVKNDLKLIALQSYLNPKSYAKREDRRQFPKFFQLGTVVGSAADFYHARLTRKERSGGSLTGQILSDPNVRKYVRKRFRVIQNEAQRNSSRPKRARISSNKKRQLAVKGRK